MEKERFSCIVGMNSPLGFVYRVYGDNKASLTKKECEGRIKSLYNVGSIGKSQKDYLLKDLKSFKRGDLD
jgi:hypothetical protein